VFAMQSAFVSRVGNRTTPTCRSVCPLQRRSCTLRSRVPCDRSRGTRGYGVERRRAVAVLGLVTLLASTPGTAEAEGAMVTPAGYMEWTSPTLRPSPVSAGAAMAFDGVRGQMIEFGGCQRLEAGTSNATYEWQISEWVPHAPATSPPARCGAAVGFDKVAQRIVLFGGTDGLDASSGYLGDTWEWDGNRWAEVTPPVSPAARAWTASAYDAKRQQLVVFGGQNAAGLSAQTWAWNGTTWTQLHPLHHPSARAKTTMTYDTLRHVMVLFGGQGPSGPLGDTWEWNGSDWTERPANTNPLPRSGASIAYHPQLGQTVMF